VKSRLVRYELMLLFAVAMVLITGDTEWFIAMWALIILCHLDEVRRP